MAAEQKVLLDTNILLDVLAHREPHYNLSAKVWAVIESGLVEGLIAAHSVTTLHYLLSTHIGAARLQTVLYDILQVFTVATIDQEVIVSALSLEWSDFEDAVQMAAALKARADYLITRNPKDFETKDIPVLMPGEFMAILDS